MHRRIERRLRLGTVHAFENHGIVAHRSPDKSLLTGKSRRRALAHDPEVLAVVRLAPGVVVMVVDGLGDVAADDLAHPLHDPLAAGIGVTAGELHGSDVAPAELGILVNDRGRDVHAVLAAGGLEIARRRGMAEATATEMDADPDKTLLVAHQVDIVVA